MKVRRGTCGLCKPTKRYKRHNRRLETWLKRQTAVDLPVRSVKLREHHHQ